MDRCFAVGGRTVQGFSGIVGGFPDLPGESVTTRSDSHGNFLTLPEVIRRRGYETMFVYGGEPLYDHRQVFLGSNGVTRSVYGKDFAQKTFRTHLGWCDEDLYAQAHEEFVAMGEKPFFALMLTLPSPMSAQPWQADHGFAAGLLLVVLLLGWAVRGERRARGTKAWEGGTRRAHGRL